MSKTPKELAKELIETGDDSEVLALDLVHLLEVINELSTTADGESFNDFYAAVHDAVERGCTYYEKETPALH